MDSNLDVKPNPGCKELLLRKLSYAVTSSVISQIIILSVFLFIVNFNILHPLTWLSLTFTTFTSASTWLFLSYICSIIFAQSIICAKDYVLKSTFSTSRIEKILSIISLRNVVLLTLHIFSGGSITWLYLYLIEGTYGSFFVKCKEDNYCLNVEFFYLITCGLFTGLYFFVRIYKMEKRILFPVIQQHKLLQFKSRLLPLVRESQKLALWPSVYFIIIYFFWGDMMQNHTSYILKLHKVDFSFSAMTILLSWFFSTLYIFTMNLMRFFFELFLTEPIDFPVLGLNKDDVTLSYALGINNIPIIQHLACFDIFLLSRNSSEKRNLIFSLSQPGNHPHNWNTLVTSILKLISECTETLNASSNAILTPEVVKKEEIPIAPVTDPTLKHYTYNNIRNLSIQNIDVPIDVINITQNQNLPFSSPVNLIMESIPRKINTFISMIKTRLGINYLFGHLPLKNIEYCLENGQILMWITQGLSNLSVASLKEDNFGVVHKDLPIILSTLVDLKISIEKLNRIPALTRKMHNSDDFYIKIKAGINSAVKRSLYNICSHFGPYINDIPLKKDVLQNLQLYIEK